MKKSILPKRINRRFAVFFVLAVVWFAFSMAYPASARPQTIVSEKDPSVPLVAEVSLDNAKMRISGEEYSIDFSLSNGAEPQSSIKYGARMVPVGRPPLSESVYEIVAEESVSLAQNSKSERLLVLKPPKYLKGEYNVFLEARSDSGMMLSLIFVNKIELSGDGKFVEMKDDSCYLTVSGDDNADARYNLHQGVDVDPDERLTLHCDVTNRSDSALSITPAYRYFYRSVFGDAVPVLNQPKESHLFAAGENKLLQIPIALPSAPQAYDVVVSLDNDRKIPSSSITAHFVLRGPSITIQNVTLDKTRYGSGEEAALRLYLSGSADSFPDSRKMRGSFDGNAKATVSLQSGSKLCGEEFTKQIDLEKEISFDISLPLSADCPAPVAIVSLSDRSGKLLASGKYDFSQTKDVQPIIKRQENESVKQGYSHLLLKMLLVFFAMLALFLVLVFSRRKALSMPRFHLLLLIALGTTFLSTDFAKASSGSMFLPYDAYCDYCSPPSWVNHDLNIVASLNKSSYAAGETVYVSAAMDHMVCANSARWGYWNVRNSWNSWQYWEKGQGGPNVPEIRSIFTAVSAPETAGYHSIRVRWYDPRGYPPWYNPVTGTWRDDNSLSGTYDGTITLELKVDAACNPSYNGKTLENLPATGLCSAGSQQGPYDYGTYWWWSCLGAESSGSAYCKANKSPDIMASCGQNARAYGATESAWPSTTEKSFCDHGNLTPASPLPAFPASSGSITQWFCKAKKGSEISQCTAKKNYLPRLMICPNPVSTLSVGDSIPLIARYFTGYANFDPMSATCSMTCNSTVGCYDSTKSSVWSPTSGSAAIVQNTYAYKGRVTANYAGKSTIMARYGGLQDSANVSVECTWDSGQTKKNIKNSCSGGAPACTTTDCGKTLSEQQRCYQTYTDNCGQERTETCPTNNCPTETVTCPKCPSMRYKEVTP